MSTRRRAREIVLQLLYEADLNDTREEVSVRRFIKSRLQGRKALTSFSEALFFGTLQHREAIDQNLSRLARGWTLNRMAIIDRNVMRMAAYEILYTDTPGRVAVNEAVVLIKRYGDKNSPRFVNGILDRLLKESESNSNVAAVESQDQELAPGETLKSDRGGSDHVGPDSGIGPS